MQDELFNEGLIRRYDTATPRYTSYPTVPQFYPINEGQVRDWVISSNEADVSGPLSIYVHVPFCRTVCYYCACTKIITNNRKHAIPYLEQLCRETRVYGELFGDDRPVTQMHWGGGTPTFLDRTQMSKLMEVLDHCFRFNHSDEGEYSIELDPREVEVADIRFLQALGFNRISLGVQDLDPRVQQAVNRVQSVRKTREIHDAARSCGYDSISFDLIYGLPFQTVKTFAATLDEVISIGPDRLSVFNYAHLPHRFKVQRQIKESQLPSPREKLALLRMSIDRLCAAGYVYIGMDHFAKAEDGLARAQKAGTLHRNFQGYSTNGGCDLIGLGLSSIGCIGGNYFQNHSKLDDYLRCLEDHNLPVVRGYEPNPDDRLRRAVINELMCHFQLSIDSFEERFGIDFGSYFQPELRRLALMQNDRLVQLNQDKILVLNPGRLLIRNICAVFDRHMDSNHPVEYSKAI